MNEKAPSLEISGTRVLEELRTKDFEDPALTELVRLWFVQEQEKAGTNSEAQIGVERALARLYFEAGYPQKAIETLDDAILHADGEGLFDLVAQINAEIDELIAEGQRRMAEKATP